MQDDDVIEIRRGRGPWWHLVAAVAFVGCAGRMVQSPDTDLAVDPSDRLAGWVVIALFGLGAVLWIWRYATRKEVALRADGSGLVDRTRLAPMRRFDWAQIAAVTTRRVRYRTLVRVVLVDGGGTNLGVFEGRPKDVARRLEEARARWGAVALDDPARLDER